MGFSRQEYWSGVPLKPAWVEANYTGFYANGPPGGCAKGDGGRLGVMRAADQGEPG